MLLSYPTKANNLSKEVDNFLNDYASLYSNIERKFYIDNYKNNETRSSLKKLYTSTFGITARHYNAIAINTDGKLDAVKKLQELYISENKEKIKVVEKVIEKKESQKIKTFESLQNSIVNFGHNHLKTIKILKRYRNIKFVLHQKNRKLRNLNHKLEKLQSRKNSICFGSRKLFLKQFNLKENGYLNHKEWLNDWRNARNSQFTFVGSKDETFGNQSCTYDLNNTLRIKVPNALAKKYGNYINIENVVFPYGQENLNKAKIPYDGYTKSKNPQPKKYYKAISYRFMKKNNNWYIIATVDVEEPKIQTTTLGGAIGIDLNAGFVSICEVDRFGNYLNTFDIKVNMYNRTSEQVKASISDAVKYIIDYALKTGKSISIEDLDFSKKKAVLTECGTKYSRMLSGLTYSIFRSMLESRAKRFGVEVIKVNPAFTSFIGHFKFMKRYGISSHSSASMVIARRGLGFKNIEKVVYGTDFENKDLPLNKTRRQQWSNLSYQTRKFCNFNDRIELLKVCNY